MSDSSQRDSRRLSDAAVDEALGAWPMPERDAMEWDEAAARVQDRIESGAAPSEISATVTDDDLFAAPLEAGPDEMGSRDSVPPHQPVSVNSRSVRPRRSFKDLADLAKSAPPPPVLVEAGVGVEAGIAAAAAVEMEAEIAAAEIVAPVVVAAVPQAAAVVPIRAATAKPAGDKTRTTAVASVIVAALALAATGVFYVRAAHHDQTAAPVAQTPAAKPLGAPTSSVPATTAPKDDAIDPMALPLANAPTATMTGMLPMAPMTAAAPLPVASASAAPTGDPAASAVASAAPAPSSSGTLEDQMRQAAGPSVSATAAPSAADTSTTPSGNLPMKPSQGAVSGALGAVMPAARACLDSEDPVSHATIVFRSDGSVKSVSLDGGIVGKPAEACVRGALMKAHVTPFAQPEFMGFATIRPN
jgi:hypothetical protein